METKTLDTQMMKLLKDTIQVMKENPTNDNKAKMVAVAMKCNFLSPVKIEPAPQVNADGTLTVLPDAKISFSLIESGEHKRYFLAFTDMEEYYKWRTDKPTNIVVAFDGYASMVLDRKGADGFVINPFTENIIFTHDNLEGIRNHIASKKN